MLECVRPVRRDCDAAAAPRAGPGQANGWRTHARGHGLRGIHRLPRQLDGSCYWVPLGLHLIVVDAILAQLKRAGFQAVFADGHGPSRSSWLENLSERQIRFELKLFGVTRDIGRQWKSQMDHAGRNETSLMIHLRPDLVDLSRLAQERSTWPQGVADRTRATRPPSTAKSVSLNVLL